MKFTTDAVLTGELKRGDKGPQVRQLIAYFTEYGYIASERAQRFGGKCTDRDVVEPSTFAADADVFDEKLEAVVRLFQRQYRLEENGAVDTTTLRLIETPRCGVPDRPRRGASILSNPVCGWPRPDLTFRIVETLPQLGARAHRDAFIACLQEWARVSGLSFTESDQVSRIQSFIYNGDGCGRTFAYAYFPCDGSVAGDTHYDTQDCWSVADTTPASRVDFVSVCLHEIGHALGLGHEPGVRGAVMYPYFGLGEQRRRAAPDDIRAIQALYPGGC